jgi:hypothetical protein
MKISVKKEHIYIKILNFVAEMFSAKVACDSDFVTVHNSVFRKAAR